MTNDLERLLEGLRDEALPVLTGTENAMWREIHRRQRAHRIFLGEVGRNGGIAAAALLIGVAVGVTRPVPQPKPVDITLLLTDVPPASLLE